MQADGVDERQDAAVGKHTAGGSSGVWSGIDACAESVEMPAEDLRSRHRVLLCRFKIPTAPHRRRELSARSCTRAQEKTQVLWKVAQTLPRTEATLRHLIRSEKPDSADLVAHFVRSMRRVILCLESATLGRMWRDIGQNLA